MEFATAEQEQVFRWRVALERATSLSDRFYVLRDILAELGDKQFVHNRDIYNPSSVRMRMLEAYPLSRSRRPETPPPKTITNYYKQHVTTPGEQIAWLEAFLDFLSFLSESDAGILMASQYNEIRELIIQYLALYQLYIDGYIRDEEVLHVYRVGTVF